MNVKQFEYLIAVAEFQNFSIAADSCCITQSTLSTMIAKYESEIGIQIFDRKTKPVTVTKEGAIVLQQIKTIYREIGVLKEVVQSLKGELTGEIKIGIIPTVAPFILPAFLNAFAKKFPDINFSVSEMTTETITDLLIKRELDIGIMAIPIGQESLTEIPLYNEPFVLYDCSGSKSKARVSYDSINFNKFWIISEGHCLHTQVKRLCDFDKNRSKSGINFEFKTGSIDSLVRFVKINRGITILPYLATLDFGKEEQMRLSQFKSPVPVRSIGLVIHNHFIKRQILNLLRLEIRNKIMPLIHENSKEEIIAPL